MHVIRRRFRPQITDASPQSEGRSIRRSRIEIPGPVASGDRRMCCNKRSLRHGHKKKAVQSDLSPWMHKYNYRQWKMDPPIFHVFFPTFLCLIHLRCLLSVFFSNRIKDEDRAVRSSNWNLRLTPPKCQALSLNKASYFRGGGGWHWDPVPGTLRFPWSSWISLQACGGHVQTREVGNLKTGSGTHKPIRIHGTVMTWMVDFYGKCSENIPVTWILWESLPKQFCWVRSWSICHLA